VRWGVTLQLIAAWVLTFPICGVIAWVVAKLVQVVTSGK
jgi:phosphate/sulfate permease